MAHPSAAWGIEIGQFAIKAIRLERSGDEVQVTDFSVVPHRKVLSTPDVDAIEMTRLSLGQLISENNLENEHLVISVPGHSAFARFAKLPPVEPKALPEIVKFEAVQQIPFPIEDVEWDYEGFREEGSPEVEVGIFAITRERVNERLDVYGEVGLSPETLTLSPVSLFNAMNYDLKLSDSKKPVVFINWHDDSPLTKSAHDSFSKGLFLFDDTSDLNEKLCDFLSLSISEIEELWEEKKEARKDMVNKFFSSSYKKNAGKLAAKIIIDKYFKT